MEEYDAPTVPLETTKKNAREILRLHLHQLAEANRRYESQQLQHIKMRETEWNNRKIRATWTTFSERLVRQDYRCAACKQDIDERACVHSDRQGNIRGLVCFNCNLILAYSHDDPYVLLQNICYLLEK